MMRSITLITILSLIIVLSGCSNGGSSSSPSNSVPPSVNVQGVWFGTWNSDGIEGSVTLELCQNDAKITGMANLTDNLCFSEGNIAGSISGNNLLGSITSNGDEIDISVNFAGSKTSATGTYTIINALTCTGLKGTLTLSYNGQSSQWLTFCDTSE